MNCIEIVACHMQTMRLKEGIKPVDPYDESIRRELCSEKLTVLVCTTVIIILVLQLIAI